MEVECIFAENRKASNLHFPDGPKSPTVHEVLAIWIAICGHTGSSGATFAILERFWIIIAIGCFLRWFKATWCHRLPSEVIRSNLKLFIAISSNLEQSGAIWCRLHNQDCSSLQLPWQIYSHLDQSWAIWNNLRESYAIWSNLETSGARILQEYRVSCWHSMIGTANL